MQINLLKTKIMSIGVLIASENERLKEMLKKIEVVIRLMENKNA